MARRNYDQYQMPRLLRRAVKFAVPLAIVLVLVLAALVIGFACKRETGLPGHESYVVRKPWGGRTTYVQTLHGIESTPLNLFYEVAEVLDMRPRRHEEKFSVTVKGDVNIEFRCHIVMAVKPDASKDVVEKYGGEFYKTRVQKPFRERVRAEVTKHAVFEVKANRNEIAANILKDMQATFADEPFVILDVLTGNIDYDPKVKLFAVLRIVKKEESNQRDIQLKIQGRDNAIKETEAEGIRESQDIIRGSLTRKYNTWNGIKAIEELAGASDDATGAARPAPNTMFIFVPAGQGGQFSLILSDSMLKGGRPAITVPPRQ